MTEQCNQVLFNNLLLALYKEYTNFSWQCISKQPWTNISVLSADFNEWHIDKKKNPKHPGISQVIYTKDV